MKKKIFYAVEIVYTEWCYLRGHFLTYKIRNDNTNHITIWEKKAIVVFFRSA